MNYSVSWNARYLHVCYSPWSPGSIQGDGCFFICNFLLLLECVGLVIHCESLWWSMPGRCTGVLFGGYVCVPFVLILALILLNTVNYLLHWVWPLLVITTSLVW
jgi:hypothetical protein